MTKNKKITVLNPGEGRTVIFFCQNLSIGSGHWKGKDYILDLLKCIDLLKGSAA